jgi:uncharacterized protein (TIGR02391 family)
MTDWPPTADESEGLPVDALAIRLLKHVATTRTNLMNLVGLARAEAEIEKQRGAGVRGTVIGTSAASLGPNYELSISEAWHWLIANGLLTEDPAQAGWFVVSRLGHKVLKEIPNPVEHRRAERRIALDLHPLIRTRVRSQFLMGEYDAAVLIAMRTVEERVRELAGATNSDLGVKLMRQAFGKDGPLREEEMDSGEAEAQMALFWGAIGVFKNPASHRRVDYGSATEASEVVLLADLLLRMLDRWEANSA